MKPGTREAMDHNTRLGDVSVRVVSKGGEYLRDVHGKGGGVIRDYATVDGVEIRGNGFVPLEELEAVLREGKRAIRPRR